MTSFITWLTIGGLAGALFGSYFASVLKSRDDYFEEDILFIWASVVVGVFLGYIAAVIAPFCYLGHKVYLKINSGDND